MTIRSVYLTFWITKALNAHLEYVMRIAFHGKNGYANAPQCYVARTLPVLFVYRYDVGIGFVHVPDAGKEVGSSYYAQYLARCRVQLKCDGTR
jgi:hypothetical protein